MLFCGVIGEGFTTTHSISHESPVWLCFVLPLCCGRNLPIAAMSSMHLRDTESYLTMVQAPRKLEPLAKKMEQCSLQQTTNTCLATNNVTNSITEFRFYLEAETTFECIHSGLCWRKAPMESGFSCVNVAQ